MNVIRVLPLFHVYIGRAYQGPIRAKNEGHACALYAVKSGKPAIILHAVPETTVQDMKLPKKERACAAA